MQKGYSTRSWVVQGRVSPIEAASALLYLTQKYNYYPATTSDALDFIVNHVYHEAQESGIQIPQTSDEAVTFLYQCGLGNSKVNKNFSLKKYRDRDKEMRSTLRNNSYTGKQEDYSELPEKSQYLCQLLEEGYSMQEATELTLEKFPAPPETETK